MSVLTNFKSKLVINPSYSSLDCDTMMFLAHFEIEPEVADLGYKGRKVLELGANEEPSAYILADNGYTVMGVDLRPLQAGQSVAVSPNYVHVQADFVQIAPLLTSWFDAVFSTSAIEHFGLKVYGNDRYIENHDYYAMKWAYHLLKPGGKCYITVPYGRTFLEDGDWRVYDAKSLEERIIQCFQVEQKLFFKSGDCACPDIENMVEQKDADQYSGKPPHVTVFLQMRK